MRGYLAHAKAHRYLKRVRGKNGRYRYIYSELVTESRTNNRGGKDLRISPHENEKSAKEKQKAKEDKDKKKRAAVLRHYRIRKKLAAATKKDK